MFWSLTSRLKSIRSNYSNAVLKLSGAFVDKSPKQLGVTQTHVGLLDLLPGPLTISTTSAHSSSVCFYSLSQQSPASAQMARIRSFTAIFPEHKQAAFKTPQLICLHLRTGLKNKINDCYQRDDERHLWWKVDLPRLSKADIFHQLEMAGCTCKHY